VYAKIEIETEVLRWEDGEFLCVCVTVRERVCEYKRERVSVKEIEMQRDREGQRERVAVQEVSASSPHHLHVSVHRSLPTWMGEKERERER
jgi:hypothetical protein